MDGAKQILSNQRFDLRRAWARMRLRLHYVSVPHRRFYITHADPSQSYQEPEPFHLKIAMQLTKPSVGIEEKHCMHYDNEEDRDPTTRSCKPSSLRHDDSYRTQTHSGSKAVQSHQVRRSTMYSVYIVLKVPVRSGGDFIAS